jgi:hypothetical protein
MLVGQSTKYSKSCLHHTSCTHAFPCPRSPLCNASLSIRPTWTGNVMVQHVTWFLDTMYNDNRSPVCDDS